LFTIGLGHLYAGDLKKGIFLFFGGQILLILAFSSFLFYAPIGPIIVIIVCISYSVYCIVDSVKLAKIHAISYSMKKYNKWYFYLLFWFVNSFIIQTIVENTAKNNIAQAYKIPSGAMKETLKVGDRIIADKFIYKSKEPKRGDIVIFPYPADPSKDFIKRIIGLGGEVIEIKDKKVMIDGTLLQEPYVVYTNRTMLLQNNHPRDYFGPVKIPENSLFVMGDNRDNSHDSRYWGFVEKSSVKGKAINIYWSWDSQKSWVRWDRILKNIK
jgi:signal peptidase I